MRVLAAWLLVSCIVSCLAKDLPQRSKKIHEIQIVEAEEEVVIRGRKRGGDDPIEICRPCPPGSFSNTGNLRCGNCGPGWCTNITYCILCPVGTYSNRSNSTECTDCSDGFIAKNKNTTKCSSCRAGETSSSDHTVCHACAPGTANPRPGGQCLPCLRGQFQANYNSYNCTPCPPASWNDQIGQATCVNCGQGHWGVAVGASAPDACSDCPEGYYCPQPRTTKPLPCPSDHYCEKGSADPSSCPFLFQSPAISTTCRPSTYFYLIFAGLGGLVLVFAVVVWITVSRYRSKKKKKSRPPKGRSEVESLIPEPLPGPVYNGL